MSSRLCKKYVFLILLGGLYIPQALQGDKKCRKEIGLNTNMQYQENEQGDWQKRPIGHGGLSEVDATTRTTKRSSIMGQEGFA